ncbi:cell division control protein 2 like protein 2 [Angomonas deanei]|nr:cell division control protein 2 like protein 2 [Angomonas deanei]|eukprot:EPY38640.1 cell division control protein 2 like protein 2 [Angomonas deanei]
MQRFVALKVITWSSQEEGIPNTAVREVSLLREVAHPNVVQLIEAIPQGVKLTLVFEFLEKDLHKLCESRITPIIGAKLKKIMFQLLVGLHACHCRRIVHRDIKPQNILSNKDETVFKLADFGLGRAFCVADQTYTYEVMTLYYRAPEILLGETRYHSSVDMWSMGCVMAEMALRRPLFSGETAIVHFIKICKIMGTPNEQTWPGIELLPHYNAQLPQWQGVDLAAAVPTLDEQGIDLLRQFFVYSPEHRITAYQALQHGWFDEVREECESELQPQLFQRYNERVL